MTDEYDEYELSPSERESAMDDAADLCADLAALRIIAGEYGLDIGAVIREAQRDACGDHGVDLDDYETVIEMAEDLVGSDASSAADRILAEMKRRDERSERQSRAAFERAIAAIAAEQKDAAK